MLARALGVWARGFGRALGRRRGGALRGQIVLEALDLVADCANRTVGPRPESLESPLPKLKYSSGFASMCLPCGCDRTRPAERWRGGLAGALAAERCGGGGGVGFEAGAGARTNDAGNAVGSSIPTAALMLKYAKRDQR